MKKLSDIAIRECVLELRAACRLPIEESALNVIVGWLRPNFERILDHPDGRSRWAECGQRMRDNARYLGTFSDFFASHTESPIVGVDDLKRAFTLVRADCTVRTERTPVAWEFCPSTPLDASAAEVFLRAVAPMSELV